jgi:hypothetical protein
MHNPEALATLGIQETGRKLTKKKEANAATSGDIAYSNLSPILLVKTLSSVVV